MPLGISIERLKSKLRKKAHGEPLTVGMLYDMLEEIEEDGRRERRRDNEERRRFWSVGPKRRKL